MNLGPRCDFVLPNRAQCPNTAVINPETDQYEKLCLLHFNLKQHAEEAEQAKSAQTAT